jgi:exonuclease VII large subunit
MCQEKKLNRARDAQQRLDHARETLQRCLAHEIDSYKRNLAHITRALQARSPARELTIRRNRFADFHRRLVACPARLLRTRDTVSSKRRNSARAGARRNVAPRIQHHDERARKDHSHDRCSPAKNENSHPCERRRIRFGDPVEPRKRSYLP